MAQYWLESSEFVAWIYWEVCQFCVWSVWSYYQCKFAIVLSAVHIPPFWGKWDTRPRTVLQKSVVTNNAAEVGSKNINFD